MPSTANPRQYPLERLRDLCTQETARFRKHADSDPRYCHELFRRAILEEDQVAWGMLYEHYQAQVTRWIRRHPSYDAVAEEAQFFVNRAFENFWKAFSQNPQKFGQFPELKHLLRFLQVCTHNLITDHLRARARRRVEALEVLPEPTDMGAGADVEQLSLGRQQNEDCWRAIRAKLNSEEEYQVFYARFVLDMKPREMMERLPDAFGNVRAIYRILERVLERLRRDDELREACL